MYVNILCFNNCLANNDSSHKRHIKEIVFMILLFKTRQNYFIKFTNYIQMRIFQKIAIHVLLNITNILFESELDNINYFEIDITYELA